MAIIQTALVARTPYLIQVLPKTYIIYSRGIGPKVRTSVSVFTSDVLVITVRSFIFGV